MPPDGSEQDVSLQKPAADEWWYSQKHRTISPRNFKHDNRSYMVAEPANKMISEERLSSDNISSCKCGREDR